MVALAIFSSTGAISQADGKRSVSVELAIDKTIERSLNQSLRSIVEAALQFVSEFPPKSTPNNIFNWVADDKLLAGKNVSIVLTHSDSRFMDQFGIPAIGELDPKVSSVTIAPVNKEKREMPIRVLLFIDKLMYDSSGNEDPHAFSRVVVALAHALYGNVQRFLMQDIDTIEPMTLNLRIAGEMDAYKKSIEFLEQLISNRKFQELPASFQEGLRLGLTKEKEGFGALRSKNLKCNLN